MQQRRGFRSRRCGSSPIPPAAHCRRLPKAQSSRTAISMCARCCAAWRAIQERSARWSRPGSTSTARCAPCAAAGAFCWAARALPLRKSDGTKLQETRKRARSDRALFVSPIGLRPTRPWRPSAAAALLQRRPLRRGGSRTDASGLPPRRCTGPGAAYRG